MSESKSFLQYLFILYTFKKKKTVEVHSHKAAVWLFQSLPCHLKTISSHSHQMVWILQVPQIASFFIHQEKYSTKKSNAELWLLCHKNSICYLEEIVQSQTARWNCRGQLGQGSACGWLIHTHFLCLLAHKEKKMKKKIKYHYHPPYLHNLI